MTAGELLRSAHSFKFSTLDERIGKGGLLVIAPHPDDESLACGGLIAEACRQRRPTRVLIVSDGAESHPHSKAYPRERLMALRESEAKQATRELGLDPDSVVFLRLPDRFVPHEGHAADHAINKILACATEVGAEAIFVTWRHDPHCDHQASFKIARAARRKRPGLKLYEYTVWGWTLPPATPIEPARDGFRFHVDRSRKQRAIAAHRSQTTAMIDDDPTGFRLAEADLAHFDYPYEFFFECEE